MQAIARVNRVFRDKPGGLVVDYIGIGDDLRESLAAYGDEIAAEAMFPLEQAISKLREKHDVVSEFFHGCNFRQRHEMNAGNRATLLVNAHAAIVADEDTKTRFLKEYKLFARWLALVSPHAAAIELKDDAEFFGAVASNVLKYTPPEEQASPEARHAVSQFFSEGLAAGEVVDIFDLAGEERPEISILSDEFLDDVSKRLGERELGVEVLKKLLRDEIQVRDRTNHIQARLFSEALNELLLRYANKQLTSAEVVKRLVELAKRMRDARRRHESLGLTVEEAAFYDALAEDPTKPTVDPVFAEVARALVKSIKADLTVDWADHEATEAAIRVKIKRLLRHNKDFRTTLGGGARSLNRVTEVLLDQARSLYRHWPDDFRSDLL
jgi:type I restriction enzyme, R subunit